LNLEKGDFASKNRQGRKSEPLSRIKNPGVREKRGKNLKERLGLHSGEGENPWLQGCGQESE